MKSLLVTVVTLLSLNASSLIAQSFSGATNISDNANAVAAPFLRGRIIGEGDSTLDLLICPNNIIARREDDHRIIHLKKGEGGVISLAAPSNLSNQSSAEWRLASTDQFLPLADLSPIAEGRKGTISIIGPDGNKVEVSDNSDSLKPIDFFKATDETAGVVSYNFSYVAITPGTTMLNFVLIESTANGDIIFKDGAAFAIQVDDADVVTPAATMAPAFVLQPPVSSLQFATYNL